MVDGKGPLPDSNLEVLAWIGIGLTVVAAFTVFSGLDAQVEYIATAPGDYLLSSTGSGSGIYFTGDQIDLMNDASKNSLGIDAIGAERLYCGEVRNGNVRRFRLADIIESSTLTSVSGSCQAPVGVFVHSQPSGSEMLSEEDKDLESQVGYTCIQYSEIAVSPVTGKVNGLNCWQVVQDGESFEEISVYSN